ncbi:MAG: hypothetical protein ACXWCN_09175, partial [Caldimonas sp.]
MASRSSTTAFAKSTRPEIGGSVRRETLFARLDGTPARTVAWIAAPPGFGKTTLAASYLEARGLPGAWYQIDRDDEDGETFFHYLAHAARKLRGRVATLPVFGPEHRADLAAFARRFFRALFAGVDEPVALVLDNLHELSAESPLRTILEAGLAEVPRPCCLVVTCRVPPPVALTRLQASGQMVCLTADELRITPAELGEMARLRGRPLAPVALAALHQRADGWAAALVLMLEHHQLADPADPLPADATPRVVFDYLAGEIFERFEASAQRLLLQLACLPRVTIEIARDLSGDENAGGVLFNLAHNDYFVRELIGPEGRVFVLHPLLKEFLLHRAARDLPPASALEARRRAAKLLRESGQLEDALALLVDCREWADVAALVAEQAEGLLGQGRHAVLAAWLDLLPPQFAADPALLLVHGAALAHSSPRAARRKFEAAFDALAQAADAPAMARCCVGIIDTLVRERDDLVPIDRWLAEFDRCRALSSDPTPLPVLVGRLWRDPAHADVARMAPMRSAADAAGREIVRATAALLDGDFVRAAAIEVGVETAAGEPRLALAAAVSLRHLLQGDPATALATARAGLAGGVAEAIHGHDVALHLLATAASLGLDDIDAARSELASVAALPLRRGDLSLVHALRAALADAEGDTAAALGEIRTALLLAVEAGLPWPEALMRIVMAQLLVVIGDRNGAEAQLRAAEALALRLGSPLLRLAGVLALAACALGFDDDAAAEAPLQAGLALARELGLRRVPVLRPALLGSVCAAALRRGIAVEQCRTLISAGRLTPPPAALRLRRWPWSFEVITLGGFALKRDGESIEFSAKGPGRPVELLKVLIALGGQNVRTEQLADALWP